MPMQRKVFRIEMMQPSDAVDAAGGEPISVQQSQEIIDELQALRSLMEQRMPAPARSAENPAGGLRELKNETEAIYRAITRTLQEIARVQAGAFPAADGARAARELDAVVE